MKKQKEIEKNIKNYDSCVAKCKSELSRCLDACQSNPCPLLCSDRCWSKYERCVANCQKKCREAIQAEIYKEYKEMKRKK